MTRSQLAQALRPLLPELSGFVRYLAGSAQEGDDLLHEIVVHALESAATIREPERLRAWMFRLARNAAIDMRRAGAVRATLLVLDGGLESGEPPVPLVDSTELTMSRLDLERALATIPQSARALVLLVDLYEFSYDEAAAILDVPIGTVRSRLFRARARLAHALVGRPQQSESAGGTS